MSMKTRALGNSSLQVSVACLGTMTWGKQSDQAQAFAQLDAFVAAGGNFVDTAELYAVPTSSETFGRTEEILGNWITDRGARDKIVLATKVAGPMGHNRMAAVRTDPPDNSAEKPCLDRANIMAAVEGSLRRLQTSYIDLYQLHWPDRYAPGFGYHTYDNTKYRPGFVSFEETVGAIGELIESGKIKHWGLSNETTYGVITMCETAKRLGVPQPISIQNDYSLCDRHFDYDLAEACAPTHYNLGLMAYGTLAGGTLSGKYRDGNVPEGTRHTLFPNFQPRYHRKETKAAAAKYAALAERKGITPAQLALAWANSRFFMGSVIIGANTAAQLEENLAGFEVTLDEETLAAIEVINKENRNPQWTD